MTMQSKAVESFKQGLSCSQAVASVFADRYGIDKDTVLRLSRGFGGGIGGMGGVCGAITGAYMVIGMSYDPNDASQKAEVYKKVQEFTHLFRQRHTEIECSNLLGCDIRTESGKALIKEKNLRDIRCSVFVQDAVEILQDILPR